MLEHYLTWLFEITLEIDGHLNKLHTRTIRLHNRLEENRKRKRKIQPGHWGVLLIENDKIVGRLRYPVGITGPLKHFPKIQQQAEDWRDRKNEMPD